jgi:hypothetical protein
MLRLFWGERSDRFRRASARRGRRPGLEGLEVRIAPAIDTWTGAVSANWMDAGNWTSGVAPSVGDDLVFPASAGHMTNNNNFPTGTQFSSITIQGPGYDLTGNALSLSTGITASYSTGTSTDAIDTALTGVVAPITVSTGGTLDITGILSGSAGTNVTGGGTLELSAINKYTGPTTIGAGTTLLVNGTTAGIQDNGGLLAGNGTVGAIASVGGTIFPGLPATATTPQPGPGQMFANGSVTLDSGSTFASLLNGLSTGNGVTGYSQLVVTTGVISLGGASLSTGLGTNYTPSVGNQLTIIRNNTGAPINGVFANLPEGGAVTVGNSLFRISYLGTNGSGSDVVLSAVSTTSSTTLLPLNVTGAGQPITLSAQVTGSQGTPTGTVEFFNGNPSSGGIVLAKATVSPVNASTGVATATVGSLGGSGTPVIYAVYIPTATTFTYAGSTSAPISFATTTTLSSSSLGAFLIGQPLTLTATVSPASPGAGTPSGTVTFVADTNNVLGSAAVNPATGQASITILTLGIGTHSIVAQFTANAPFQNSTSNALTQSISTAGTTPVLTIRPVRNRQGKVVSFDLVTQVQSTVATANAIPTGAVTYFINGRAFYRTVGLSNGFAVLRRPWQRLINQYIYVRYNGSATFVASASKNYYLSHRLLTLTAQGPASGRPALATGHGAVRPRHSSRPR